MSSPEQAPASRPVRERRVGTFTFGAALVICGVLMLVGLFFPRLDLTLALKLSPLALVWSPWALRSCWPAGGRESSDTTGWAWSCASSW